jgi:hypothetical protein
VESPSVRRARAVEGLRRQLREIAETLGMRDLETVTAFAEFVAARRAARGYPQRHGESEGEASTEHSLAEDVGQEDAPDSEGAGE